MKYHNIFTHIMYGTDSNDLRSQVSGNTFETIQKPP